MPCQKKVIDDRLDKKINNVIGQMGFDLDRTKESETLQTFFDFA